MKLGHAAFAAMCLLAVGTMGATGSCCQCPVPVRAPSVTMERDTVFNKYIVGSASKGHCTNCHVTNGPAATSFDIGNGSVDAAENAMAAYGLLPSTSNPSAQRLIDANSPTHWFNGSGKMPKDDQGQTLSDAEAKEIRDFVAHDAEDIRARLDQQASCEDAGPAPGPTPDAAPPGCAAPKAMCGGTCVDLKTNVAHCGTCGTSCGHGACKAGHCCCEEACGICAAKGIEPACSECQKCRLGSTCQ